MDDENLPDGRSVFDLKVSELREELGQRNLSKAGVKAILQKRLRKVNNKLEMPLINKWS